MELVSNSTSLSRGVSRGVLEVPGGTVSKKTDMSSSERVGTSVADEGRGGRNRVRSRHFCLEVNRPGGAGEAIDLVQGLVLFSLLTLFPSCEDSANRG